MKSEFLDPLISAAHSFSRMGWLLATSGNFSRRIDSKRFYITKSGKDKGELAPEDFLEIVNGDTTCADGKASAETCIHHTLYQRFEDAQAIYHVHEPYAGLCGRRDFQDTQTLFSGWEMIKGLGVWEDVGVGIPIFSNHLDVQKIADEIEAFFDGEPAQVPVINIVGHGIYVWGDTPALTRAHLEAAAYLFKVDYLEKKRI